MRRMIGVGLLLPGLGLLGLGAYLLSLSVISYNALYCCAAIGGGLTLMGGRQLLGAAAE